jgi:hypothetical protein
MPITLIFPHKDALNDLSVSDSGVACARAPRRLSVMITLPAPIIMPVEYDIASLYMVSVYCFCDQSVREKALRSRKRGA